ncbi:zinc finger BED domain-containing protein 4-like [Dermacentor silvarum]|uniref:zinc finger BED domain-containing protein 4-like n=1 Tax=Dermacentor silvarum TaxID=543639 RepID=UPI0021014F04|nr:zinc finger BED domain-containing protein 4-like [Dermacentor silvarum]
MTERTKSAIWKHFVKNSVQEATCKSCDTKLRTPSSTTTPLVNHLKNKHFSLHSVFLRDSGKQGRPEGAQPLIKSAMKSGKALLQRERMAMTTRIARMLVLDLQPYIFVENRGFKELMNHMEPLYKIPSRTTFSRTIIPALYRDPVTAVKEIMHADFQEGIESILFTNDMWTLRSNQSYISLTCHYLASNFEMRSIALDNRSVTESHTACNILEHLQAMMDNWELPKVPVCVVTDNARNFRAVLRGISCVPMQCMGHTLQLTIKDAKEETAGVPVILKKRRAIVGHYTVPKLRQDCRIASNGWSSQFWNLFETWKLDGTVSMTCSHILCS